MSQQAFFTGFAFHRLPRPLRPLRDLVYDHTPLLQKVIGDDTPKHILSQLAEIDAVEAPAAGARGRRALFFARACGPGLLGPDQVVRGRARELAHEHVLRNVAVGLEVRAVRDRRASVS